MKIRAIITGATGMVGEGVLHECLLHPDVEAVLVINRQPCGVEHPKLKEIIHGYFYDISSIEDVLHGYNACYFCLGVSSVGMAANKYYKLTYTLTMHIAQTLSKFSPDMTFCYVSGAHTDTTEKGKLGWARVKGKTENDLFKLPFKQVFAFRPSYIQPTKGLKHTHKFYYFISWMYPLLRIIFRNSVCTLKELGLAMINVTINGYETKIVEGKDILALAKM